MFSALSDLGEFKQVYPVVEQVVDCECKCALESCRARKSRAERHISCKCRIESLHLAASLDSLTAYAEYISGPCLFGFVFLFQTEFRPLVIVYGQESHLVRAVEAYLCDYAFVDSSRKYEASVVISVFAYEIDASGGCIQYTVGSECFVKFGRYFRFDVHCL